MALAVADVSRHSYRPNRSAIATGRAGGTFEQPTSTSLLAQLRAPLIAADRMSFTTRNQKHSIEYGLTHLISALVGSLRFSALAYRPPNLFHIANQT